MVRPGTARLSEDDIVDLVEKKFPRRDGVARIVSAPPDDAVSLSLAARQGATRRPEAVYLRSGRRGGATDVSRCQDEQIFRDLNNGWHSVYFHLPEDANPQGDDFALVDLKTGEISAVRRPAGGTGGDRFMAWLFPLHAGSASDGPAGFSSR